MKKINAYITSFFISLATILFFIDFMAVDISYYHSFHKSYEISKISNLSEDWISNASEGLVNFIKYGNEKYINQIFNNKEVMHMRDVFTLFKIDRFVYKTLFFISILIIIYYFYKKDSKFFDFLKNTIIRVYLIFLAILGTCTMFFSDSFIYFHEIFFSNDLWLLDYEADLMIRILPEEFFMILFKDVLVLSTIFIFSIYLLLVVKQGIQRRKYGS